MTLSPQTPGYKIRKTRVAALPALVLKPANALDWALVLAMAPLGCVDSSSSNGDGKNKPGDAQVDLVPDGGFAPDGEYESAVDTQSLKDFGITTVEASDCGGNPEEPLEWSSAIHLDQASYIAAHERRRGYQGPPREVNFETHVVIEVYAGEWGGCGEYVELTGVRDVGNVIEIGARFVAVCGDDGESFPYLFASAPRLDKPYVVVQKEPRCPPCHSNYTVTLQCRDEETRRCTGEESECSEGTVRVLPLDSTCSLSEERNCASGGCLTYYAEPLDTEAECWRDVIMVECAPLPEHCLSSGECNIPHADGIGCYVELATGKQFKEWSQNITGNPRFRECTEAERDVLLDLPQCD